MTSPHHDVTLRGMYLHLTHAPFHFIDVFRGSSLLVLQNRLVRLQLMLQTLVLKPQNNNKIRVYGLVK